MLEMNHMPHICIRIQAAWHFKTSWRNRHLEKLYSCVFREGNMCHMDELITSDSHGAQDGLHDVFLLYNRFINSKSYVSLLFSKTSAVTVSWSIKFSFFVITSSQTQNSYDTSLISVYLNIFTVWLPIYLKKQQIYIFVILRSIWSHAVF